MFGFSYLIIFYVYTHLVRWILLSTDVYIYPYFLIFWFAKIHTSCTCLKLIVSSTYLRLDIGIPFTLIPISQFLKAYLKIFSEFKLSNSGNNTHFYRTPLCMCIIYIYRLYILGYVCHLITEQIFNTSDWCLFHSHISSLKFP